MTDPNPSPLPAVELPAVVRQVAESWQPCCWFGNALTVKNSTSYARPMTAANLAELLSALDPTTRAAVLGEAIRDMTPELAIEILTKDERIADMFAAAKESESRTTRAEARVAEVEAEHSVALGIIRLCESMVSDDFAFDLDARLHATDTPTPEMTADEVRLTNRKFSVIYQATHSFDPEHSCHRVHEDWRKEALARIAEMEKR